MTALYARVGAAAHRALATFFTWKVWAPVRVRIIDSRRQTCRCVTLPLLRCHLLAVTCVYR